VFSASGLYYWWVWIGSFYHSSVFYPPVPSVEYSLINLSRMLLCTHQLSPWALGRWCDSDKPSPFKLLRTFRIMYRLYIATQICMQSSNGLYSPFLLKCLHFACTEKPIPETHQSIYLSTHNLYTFPLLFFLHIICISHLSITITNTWGISFIKKKGLFWFMVSEVLVHDQLASLLLGL
jgi:hypothetical protein